MEWFGAAALDARISKLRPLDFMKLVSSPTLVIAGDQDSKVRPSETRQLFDACGAERKWMCWIRGGRHTYLWLHAPDEYFSAISDLLGNLGGESPRRSGSRN